mmetsp:Transcript_125857/g.350686  ORF Transcript_125857/g.350686 Transcript_125857/m.350686 type:complete len:218 (+) Transcript_125857:442-1095(+)
MVPAFAREHVDAPVGAQLDQVVARAGTVVENLADCVREAHLMIPFGMLDPQSAHHVVCILPGTHPLEECILCELLAHSAAATDLGPRHLPKMIARLRRRVGQALPQPLIWVEAAKCRVSIPFGVCDGVNLLATEKQPPSMNNLSNAEVIPPTAVLRNSLLEDAGPKLASPCGPATQEAPFCLVPRKLFINHYIYRPPGLKIVERHSVPVELVGRKVV